MNSLFASVRDRLSRRVPREADAVGRAQAAVAIVLVPVSETQLDLLFIRRAEMEGDPWSGQMAFPGGRREPSDADLLETARRETKEEIGLDLPVESALGVLDDLAPMTPSLPPILVRPFVFGVSARPEITPNSEVALHLWTPLGELPDRVGNTEITVRGTRIITPAYHVGPHVVWGMTHRIVKHLLDLVT